MSASQSTDGCPGALQPGIASENIGVASSVEKLVAEVKNFGRLPKRRKQPTSEDEHAEDKLAQRLNKSQKQFQMMSDKNFGTSAVLLSLLHSAIPCKLLWRPSENSAGCQSRKRELPKTSGQKTN